MHFAVADLHKWNGVDCWNYWIAREAPDPWSPCWASVGVWHETSFGITLDFKT